MAKKKLRVSQNIYISIFFYLENLVSMNPYNQGFSL